MSLAPSAQGVISGIPDLDNSYSAVAGLGSFNCSAVLVARRVALTSAHCLAGFATQCMPYASGLLKVRFAEPNGTIIAANTDTRTIDVQSIEVHHDAAVNVSQCATGAPCADDNLDCAEINGGFCPDPSQEETPDSVNRSSEIVVLFLADEAPSDVTPMKILVHPTYKNSSNRFVSFAGLTDWVEDEKPLVTAVGYGTGSQDYLVNPVTMARVTGRDRGVLRWEETSSLYSHFLGWQDCATRNPLVAAPAVVVAPDDITDADSPPGSPSTPGWCFVAAGSDISGASQSHASCGDSGGPIVVGAGPGAKGETPTPLPSPVAAGDTYSPSESYVAGTASLYTASIDSRPATAYNPTWTASASSFLTAHLFDSDGDGLVNKLDEFPGCDDFGPDQDLDGVPDECDPCPCDPGDEDEDGDGICRIRCQGAGDNCWQTFNPGQENCNLASELEHTPASILGDHCDPVPCPATALGEALLKENVVDYHYGTGHSQIWWRCSSYSRNLLSVRPLRSHPATGVNVSPVDVPKVPTHARFCQRDLSRGILCDDPFALQDARLADSGCAPPASCTAPETIDTHWHRMTFTLGGNGADPNGPAPTPDYVYTGDSAGGGFTWIWDYASDWQRWTQQGLIDNAPAARDLDGAIWLHADSQVGATDLSLGTGFHGGQLANDYTLIDETETLRCTHGTTFVAVHNPFFLLLTLPDPAPEDFRRWDAVRGEGSFMVPVGGSDWGAIDSLGNAQILTSRMTSELRGLLRDRSLVWANAVEAGAVSGGGVALPAAVALAADGSDLVGGMTIDGGQLDAANGIAPRTGSPHAVGFVPVYTRARRGVFVVGGSDPETAVPTGEIWFTPIDGEKWRRIPTAITPGRVLAATYSPNDGALWILDEGAAREARLWVHDVATGESSELGRWRRHAAWNRHWLVNDADGSVLLASSNSRQRRHAIARIEISGESTQSQRNVAGILRGRRALALPPLADGAGYTRVAAGVPGWPSEAVAAITAVRLGVGARVEGDVAALDGTTARDGTEGTREPVVVVGARSRVEGYVTADRVRVEGGGNIARGVIRTKRLEASGPVEAQVERVARPTLPIELPRLPSIAAGRDPVIVRRGDTATLEPGAYGRVLVESGSSARPTVLRLTGGRYGLHSLDLREHAELVCEAPCEVVVLTRLRSQAGARLGPGSDDLQAAEVQLFVIGGDAEIGPDNRLEARLFVPRGHLAIGPGSTARGTFVGRAVSVGDGATVTKDERALVVDRLPKLELAPAGWSDLADQL